MIKHVVAWIVELQHKRVYLYLILATITLIAALLRFYKLGEWSFWGDEMFTVGGREDGFNYTWVRQSISLMLIQATVASLGSSEWNARLIPALIGTFSIPILYFPIKKIFGPTVGLVTGLLLAISPWHLYWSQNARFYVALLLFYTLALLTFYIALEEDRPWYMLGSLIFLGLAVKERLLGLFFIPVVLAYLTLLMILPFEKPPGLRWRNFFIFGLPSLILGLFFAEPYLRDLSGWMAGFGYPNNDPFWILAGVIFYVGLPTVCIGTVGMLYALSQKNRAALLLGLGGGIPLMAVMGISPFHYTANRYVFIVLTSWIILASLAAVELLRRTQAQTQILAVGVLLFLLSHALGENVLYYRYQNGNRDNWKAAFQWVNTQKEEGDLIFTINPELGNYYMQEKVIPLENLDPASLEESGKRAWVVEDMVAQRVYPNTHQWLEKHARLMANFDVHAQARTFNMRVYLYDQAETPIPISTQVLEEKEPSDTKQP